jgi:SNF2 family DNA or RNA helicase
MKYNPHDYQKYSIDFIENNPISALLLECGLGKTSITLTAINDLMFDSFDVSKVLVICPIRVANTWVQECKKWEHLNDLRISVAVGSEMERLRSLRAKADIYVINRENVQWLIESSGITFNYQMVVIDEMSSFKNGKSKRCKALLQVRSKIDRIVGLTATPTSNGLMDLWSQYRILDGGKRLGRFITEYRNRYFMPDKRNGVIIYSYKLLPFAEEAIYEKISDITISMKAKDHLKMPELISSEYKVYMDDTEKAQYELLKHDLVVNLDEDDITAVNAAVLSNKLCQMANGAIYTDKKIIQNIHDRKLDALEDIVEQMNGKNFLLVYWFKHDLERIIKRLNDIGASYSKIDTTESIEEWNKGKIQVGLIHPASAGHGINLQQGGSTIVFFSLTWSLELYEQVIGRIYRQGQISDTVVVQHIITDGTIDEDILRALKDKDETQASLIKAVKARIGGAKDGKA